MKKKIIIAIIIFVGVIVGMICFIVFHNKSEDNKKSISPVNTDSILIDFQKSLDDTLSGTDKHNMPLYLSSLKEKTTCEVVSASAIDDNGTYSATIKITYADVSGVIINYLETNSNEPFDEEKINRDISELVSKSELSTSECEIYFIPDGDGYSPVFTEEIIDKMYGGIYSAYYNKLDEIASEQKGSVQE